MLIRNASNILNVNMLPVNQSSHFNFHTKSAHRLLRPFKYTECNFVASRSNQLTEHVNSVNQGVNN